MENKDETLKKLVSGEPEAENEALREIRENGDLSLVPALFDLLDSHRDHHSASLLISLLADIKENAFKDLLIDRIRSTTDTACKVNLIRIGWESSLDYSAYLDLFTEIILNEDFTVGFEACSLIEEMRHIPSLQVEQTLCKLKSIRAGEEKQPLIDIVLKVLADKAEEQQAD